MRTTRTPRPAHASLLLALVLGAACADAGSVGVAPEEPFSVHAASADRQRVFVPPGARADTALVRPPARRAGAASSPWEIGARVLADGRIVGRDGAVLGRLRTPPPGASGDIGGATAAAGGYDASARTPPRTVDAAPGLPTVAARDGDEEGCWYLVIYYIDTGEIISVSLLGCTRGGGGGRQCTPDQKAIAAEYAADRNVDGTWECDTFDDVVTTGTGTHGHEKGYLSSRYTSGRDAVWSYMLANHGVKGWINSDWRCPVGNSLLPKSSKTSIHMYGSAGDFDAKDFDERMWLQFQDAARAAGAGEYSGFSGGDPANRRRFNYRGYIHIDW